MSSPPQSATANRVAPTPEELAEAAQRRFQAQAQPQRTAQQQLQLHEKKQRFRRMIDPGIVRPNSKEAAMSSLKTLATIAGNLLKDPSNPKFQKFKPTNSVIKRELVDRKGVLEYAIEMGFRPEVENFQPYYVWHSRHEDDLKIGAQILEEFNHLYHEKEEREASAKANEKAAAAAASEKVRLQFMEDRMTRQQRDEMEKEAREARRAAGLPEIPAPPGPAARSARRAQVEDDDFEGEGRTLRDEPVESNEEGKTPAPPPYEG
ncbi:hypothetical protein BKA70DRAFT_1257279 [Coprinopsis sp. MPI-PUGE-AT-0042]|nr:hypothetical protein BKA70DRAFT_1257279 [Coprinopsis sp. MPI-PUGE-AT-0042]